jgi:hypothetical protein
MQQMSHMLIKSSSSERACKNILMGIKIKVENSFYKEKNRVHIFRLGGVKSPDHFQNF